MTTNWAGNVVFSADRVLSPGSLSELRSAVTAATRAHVVGAGHSFSRIADTTGTLLSLAHMPSEFAVGDVVRVGAGVRLAALATRMDSAGLALHTMPSLPHITAAGAVATATHGSGSPSLASAVRSLELMTADGTLVTISGDELSGAVVSFGALGVVTALDLAAVPAFPVTQTVWERVPWDVLVDRFDTIFASAYSVSAFVDWQGSVTLWVKHDGPPPDLRWTGGVPADGPRHPVPGQPASRCTEQLGVPGPWHERLPHFRAEFTPSVGAELQSEYFVPLDRAAEALRALMALGPRITPLLQACELRTVSADTHWLSPAFGRDSLAVHFTWIADVDAVCALLPHIEAALEPRPHWGKLFTVPPAVLATRYPEWDRFAALLDKYDPTTKFRNATLTHFFP